MPSIEYDDAVDATNPMPASAAPRAAASSPSGCTIDCTPTGANSTGAACWTPNISVRRSRVDTSRSIRGTIRCRVKAALFSSSVSSVPALPNT